MYRTNDNAHFSAAGYTAYAGAIKAKFDELAGV
jgi:lysophospholipase L1-like esterase